MFLLKHCLVPSLSPNNSRGQPWNGGGASFTRGVPSQSNGQCWRERLADLRPVSDQLPSGRHLGLHRAQAEAVPRDRSLLRETWWRWCHVIITTSSESRTCQETPPCGDRHPGHTGWGRRGRKASNACQRNLPQARECTDRYGGWLGQDCTHKIYMFTHTSMCRCMERWSFTKNNWSELGCVLHFGSASVFSHLKSPNLNYTHAHIHPHKHADTPHLFIYTFLQRFLSFRFGTRRD